jgi:AcrR family transcriptional regulator
VLIIFILTRGRRWRVKNINGHSFITAYDICENTGKQIFLMRESDTKQKIIKASTDLFYEHGFVKASIRDIVRKVGVTNAAFYNHFKSKDEILYHIIEEIGTTLLEELQKAADANGDPKECLKEMIFRQVCLMSRRRKEIKIYMEEQYQLPTVMKKQAMKQHRRIYDFYKEKVSGMKARGLMYGLDATVVTFAIFAMMNWSYRWFRDNGKLCIEEVADQIIRIFFSGISQTGGSVKRNVSGK